MAGRLAKLNLVNANQIRKDVPEFNVGDTVKMKIKVMEADKLRLHSWEGIVIGKVGTGSRAMFTVRKASFGEGVEKQFPLHSPVIASLKVVSRGNVKRAKLFYLRDKIGKGARVETQAVSDADQAAQLTQMAAAA
ncbi:MAG: 50S ribosomal protein L19 [Candidatus Omnitrophica bacterium]|nr:50S ribosomal protein L19 [Candidatus Omnitrophota bacterium]